MPIATISKELAFPVEDVWRIVADFGNLRSWSRAVTDCICEGQGIGSHRVIVAGASRVRERLDEWDPVAHRMVYTPVSGSSLPVRALRATIALTPLSAERTRVDWIIEGEPLGDASQVAAQLHARYAARLEELRGALAFRAHARLAPGTRWRHKKRGSFYTEVGIASVQSAHPIVEGDRLVIYLNEAGELWARPQAEFEDGRFEKVA